MWMGAVIKPQYCVVILVILYGSIATGEHKHVSTSTKNSKSDKVCQSMDIRNTVDALRHLEGCEVVEGFVQILLIDKANESDYENISFPDLREITCYLLLYRVQGLRSIGQLFPNLSVIRGNKLFYDFALVVYEMFQLQEIGLWGLTSIVRGDVRIEKNPSLCYVDTVDWSLITAGERVIMQNKPKEECSSRVCSESGCERSLCWGSGHCQKLHQDGCHEMCLGGCVGPGPRNCTVCKHMLVDDECVQNCPPDRYNYLSRRCVTKHQCCTMGDHHLTRPNESLLIHNAMQEDTNYWTFNQSCVQQCPSGYEKKHGDDGLITCEECRGRCRHLCMGILVDSIAKAQNLRGCTYINGSLVIKILQGKYIVKELEDSLSMIEEIYGYLKVVRSFSFISLSFLKNLRVIHGKELDHDKYALVVLENQNLQELWDWKSDPNRKLEIHNGRLFFHQNPKLCRSHIDELQKRAGLSNYTNLEVARESNGDKVACNIINLNTNVSIKGSTFVVIEWEPCVVPDPLSLLGYIVYYIEAPVQNVTAYDGRDSCGNNGWRVKDVTIPDDPDYNATTPLRNVNYILTHLEPFTQYAFYIMTYSLGSTGGQSNIQYFTTLPERPSVPRELTVISNSSAEILLQWEKPLHPNGILSHYIISGVWLADDQQFLGERDYCTHPLNIEENEDLLAMPMMPTETSDMDEDNPNCIRSNCTCKAVEKQKIIKDKEEYELLCRGCIGDHCIDKKGDWDKACSNFFYNLLHTALPKQKEIYKKDKDNDTHHTSEMKKFPETVSHSWPTWGHLSMANQTSITEGRYDRFYHYVNANETSMVLKNLHHFGEYMIQLVACREPYDTDDSDIVEDSSCSFASLVTLRTQRLPSADLVNSSHVTVSILNRTAGAVHIQWKEPKTPNGLVVSYQIEYKRTDIEHYKPKTECITRKQYEMDEGGFVLRSLLPGRYGFRIKVISLAGDGPFTKTVHLDLEESSQAISHHAILGVVFGAILILVCIFIFAYCWRRYYNSKKRMKLIATVNPDYIGLTGHTYMEDEWEVSRDKLELHGELGQGSFGMVYEGVLKPTKIRCAVKMVNENASVRERMEFLNEASVMKSFAGAHHVVRLLGVVSHGHPPLVIMELMARGDLKSFLRSAREVQLETPGLRDLLRMAAEIADGMAYLEANKFVHRDLAARNCMVAEDLTVKIGDFGMTRDIYETDYYRNGSSGLLPVRWMAPESLADGVFSSQSDVWSYGVVLWEMATLAEQPYQGLANEQVLQYVLSAGLLERPPSCPNVLHGLMLTCWQWRPSYRPTFLQLLAKLEDSSTFSPLFRKFSFYHSSAGQELKGGSGQQVENSNVYTAVSPPHVTFYHSDNDNEIVHWTQNSDAPGEAIIPVNSVLHFKSSLPVKKNESHSEYIESNVLVPESPSSRHEIDGSPKNKIPNGDTNGYVVRSLLE